jgi:hypothetical protein
MTPEIVHELFQGVATLATLWLAHKAAKRSKQTRELITTGATQGTNGATLTAKYVEQPARLRPRH